MIKFPYHIRPIEILDIEKYFELMDANRKRLSNYFPITTGKIKDINSTRDYIESKIKNAQEKTQFVFVIEHLEEKHLAGYIIVKNLDWIKYNCELAYWLGDGYEGRGIMSYAIHEINKFCFEYLKMNRIYLRIDPENDKSRNLAKRLGFTIHHTAEKEYQRGDGLWVDVEYWEMMNTL